MDILLFDDGPERRIPGLDFDADGPRIGAAPLLAKTPHGFAPRAAAELDAVLQRLDVGAFEAKQLGKRLETVARALNAGDVALAAIATSQLRLRAAPTAGLDLAVLRKARADDPVHPAWPAKTPGGRGGKYRPKDMAVAPDPAGEAERLARIERLEARRGIRAALRRVLSAKRAARLLLEGFGEAVPGFEAVDTAALVEDVAEIAGEVAEENVEADAAKAFVEAGPRTLEELTMSAEEESFASFDDFKKMDLDKVFGRAGDGYEYHHIVEQGAGFSQDQLQSTSNIVRIPTLLHEEVNASFARADQTLGGVSLRQSLQGTSFERQREAGLTVLRDLGLLYP